MSLSFSFIYGLLFSFLLFGQSDKAKIEINHLTDNFYVFTTYRSYKDTPFPSNGLYLVTDKGVVLIDTPWDTTQFQPLLDSIQIRHKTNVILCISTHSHEDRTAGLEYYKDFGIKTYTSVKSDEISKVKNEKRAEFLFEKDTTFTVGNYTLQTFYAGAGHTPDNIVIWFPNEKILYGGCLIKSTDALNLGNLADANINEWESTLKRIKKTYKRPKYIIPGHQSWNNTNSLKHTLKLVRKFMKKNN